MNKTGAEIPLWENAAAGGINAQPLSENIHADIVVIGGGYTGCSAALHAAEKGGRVCLIEARTVGYGGSGRNVGFVNPGLWLPPEKVEKTLGAAQGGSLNKILAQAPAFVFSLIDRFQIDCDARQNGNLYCAHARTGLKSIHDRYRQEKERGGIVTLLSAGETAAATGAKGFHGGLLYASAGTIQPLQYCRGLARAAMRSGALVFEHTPAIAIHHNGTAWHVKTPAGAVTAEALLMCTNAYHAYLEIRNAPRVTSLYWFQAATHPLDKKTLAGVMPHRHGCLDTDIIPTSFRLDSGGRLILGSVGDLKNIRKQIHVQWAQRKIKKIFPQTRDCTIEQAWSGRIGMTPDNIPRIVRLGPRGISIFGYNGRGIGPGTVFGKLAAQYALSGDESVFPLPFNTARPEKNNRFLEWSYEAGAATCHVLRDRL